MSEDAVTASARGASFLILLQVASRGLTFTLNQVLLRFLSPALLGAAVQLELYVISAHHFSRESLRVACQRQQDGGIQAAVNLSYLAILGGLPIILLLAQWYLSTAHPDVPYFVESLRISELAAMIELLSEPAFVAVQHGMLYKTRAAAEASAVVIKTITTAGSIFWAQYKHIDLGLLPFAIGELAYCSALTVVYLFKTSTFARVTGFSLKPRPIKSSSGKPHVFSLFSVNLLNLSASLYLQSALKYILTQGDTLVSSTLASVQDQGTYALASNYGGLIARMVFRPIEDSTRNLFANLCAMDETPAEPKKVNPQTRPADNVNRAATILHDVLRIYVLFGALVAAIGPTAAPLLLNLIAGARWTATGAGNVLGMYTLSIPLLAINGISEAFVAATASAAELRRQSWWMAIVSATFAGNAWISLKVLDLGANGLVLANCVNMTLRIIFNLWFAKSYFSRHGTAFGLADLLPNPMTISVVAAVPALLLRGDRMFSQYGVLGDLVRTGIVGIVSLLAIIASERVFLRNLITRLRS